MTDHLQEARDILERSRNIPLEADIAVVAPVLLASIAHSLIAIAEHLQGENVPTKNPDVFHENCLKGPLAPGSIHRSDGTCCSTDNVSRETLMDRE